MFYLREDLLNIPSKQIHTNFGSCGTDIVELHVYGGKTLIATDYEIEYKEKRKLEYGTWEEQLDMMHHGTWEAHVQAVRDKYPK